MKTLITINEDHQAIIPAEVIQALHLKPGAQIRVEFEAAEESPRKKLSDEEFSAAIEKVAGTHRQQLLDQGFASVDEFMAYVRPEW